MAKLQRLSEFQHTFSFSSQTEQFDQFYQRFLQSDLGKIYQAVPWTKLVKDFGLKDCRKGPNSLFSPRGKLGLMFLKHYSQSSDRALIEGLNGNIEWQFFCDIYLGTNRLTNIKIVSAIRCELAEKLNIEEVQQGLYSYWSPHINNKQSIATDATCYESHLRYPTDVKLLWECVDWLYGKMRLICHQSDLPLPRTKYLKWKKRYVSYSKMRRKTSKKRNAITRSLLLLLDKLNGILNKLDKGRAHKFPASYHRRRSACKKVFEQQATKFKEGVNLQHRIVSIDRPYIRPIVRGKEIKSVEFGAKLNKLQIDGISFIEHLDFEAFHEGNRLIDTIFMAQRLTGIRTKIVGADSIYATNKNRKFVTSHGIKTDFKRKGKAGKHEKQRKQLASMITKERASRLEGSFGKDKEHYHLKRVKARTKSTEILWIFFGIHTGNALEVGRRMSALSEQLKQAA